MAQKKRTSSRPRRQPPPRVPRVLLVEDDPLGANFVKRVLVTRGFAVDVCPDGEEAIARVLARAPDVVVLDWHLPGTHGRDVCTRLRGAGAEVPILVLTGDNSEEVVAEALAVGADDHAHKLMGQAFLARLDALVRRRGQWTRPLEVGELIVDPVARAVYRKGKDLGLTRLEFEIIHRLARSWRQTVPRDEIIRSVWGPAPSANAIHVRIRTIRTKLGDAHWMLQTYYRVGYRLTDVPASDAHGGDDELGDDAGSDGGDGE